MPVFKRIEVREVADRVSNRMPAPAEGVSFSLHYPLVDSTLSPADVISLTSLAKPYCLNAYVVEHLLAFRFCKTISEPGSPEAFSQVAAVSGIPNVSH